MNIHFHIPLATINRCFAPRDLAAIGANHQVWLPSAELDAAGLRAELDQRAHEVQVLVTGWGTPSVESATLGKMPNLAMFAHSAGSLKETRLIPPEIFERSVVVTSANDALAVGVAETTLGMIIAGLKNFFGSREWTRDGHWSADDFGAYGPVQETYGKTIGIVSAGQSGRHLIRLLKNFDFNILVYDPYLTAEDAAKLGVESVTLEALAQRSDVLTIHAPELTQTRGLIGRQILALLRDGAIVINTARGSIIDESALLEELQARRLRAFLDVTDPEPPSPDHPFRHLPNVVLTPHLAGNRTNGCFRQGALVAAQIADFVAGRKPVGTVSPQQFAITA